MRSTHAATAVEDPDDVQIEPPDVSDVPGPLIEIVIERLGVPEARYADLWRRLCDEAERRNAHGDARLWELVQLAVNTVKLDGTRGVRFGKRHAAAYGLIRKLAQERKVDLPP